MPSLAWIHAAVAITALLGLVAVVLWWTGNRRSTQRLPQEWPLMQRPVFSWEERALYRQLRTALPNHTILAKLPLVRFCQPIEREDLRFWFELLGPIHVSFVVCATNGRALAAIDIDKPGREMSERTLAIKQAVLEACHIRYVKCRSDQMPSIAELQLLVPAQGEQARPQVPDHNESSEHATLAHTVRSPRTASDNSWKESGFASDSFFAHERQSDADDEMTAAPATSTAHTPHDATFTDSVYAPSVPPAAPPQRAQGSAQISSIRRAPNGDLKARAIARRDGAAASTGRGEPIPFPSPERQERHSRESVEQENLRNELRRGIQEDLRLDTPPAFSSSPRASAPTPTDLRVEPQTKPLGDSNNIRSLHRTLKDELMDQEFEDGFMPTSTRPPTRPITPKSDGDNHIGRP